MQNSRWEPSQQSVGRAHDAGGDGSRPMPENHNQDRRTRAAGPEASDIGLGCSTRAHTVPRDWTLRGDCVLQVWWDTKKAAPAICGRRQCQHQQLTGKHFICNERGAHATQTFHEHAPMWLVV